MGWCLKGKSRCERDRFNKLKNEKRGEYPELIYNYDTWKNVPSSEKLKSCNALGLKVERLRLLKGGSQEDVALSDGYRVDERYAKVYGQLYSEYNTVFNRRYCTPIIDTDQQNKDAVELKRVADLTQKRIEKDTEKQRTYIIAVGGVVLLLGTVIILRKL